MNQKKIQNPSQAQLKKKYEWNKMELTRKDGKELDPLGPVIKIISPEKYCSWSPET